MKNRDCRGWQYYYHAPLETKYGLSKVIILLSYQAVETKYGLSRVKIILSHLDWIKIGVIEVENGLFFSWMEILRLCHSTNVIPMTTSISVSWRKIYRQFKVRTRCSCSSSYNVHVRVGILLTCETKLDLPLFFFLFCFCFCCFPCCFFVLFCYCFYPYLLKKITEIPCCYGDSF